jgi:hypothetical protein
MSAYSDSVWRTGLRRQRTLHAVAALWQWGKFVLGAVVGLLVTSARIHSPKGQIHRYLSGYRTEASKAASSVESLSHRDC